MSIQPFQINHERNVRAFNGWVVLLPVLAILVCDIFYLSQRQPGDTGLLIAVAIAVFCGFSFKGFFTLQPNEARVLLLFGSYKGTVRTPGFHWANPFYSNGLQGRSWAGVSAEIWGRGADREPPSRSHQGITARAYAQR